MPAKKTTPKRMGRPPTPEGEAPARSIRVSDADWARWKKAAAAKGVTLSEWLRSLADNAIARK